MNWLTAHWQEIVGSAAAYGILSYAARTFPTPKNIYARWLVGVVQFALANPDKAKMSASSIEDGAGTMPGVKP